MTAPNDLSSPESRPRSRRALLAGALGGLGALAASAVGRVSPAAAANGDPVVQGQTNTATATTVVQNTTQDHSALWGSATATSGTGVGVRGSTASQYGYGVWGEGGYSGVQGTGSAYGVYGDSLGGDGVRGYTTSGTGTSGWSTSGRGASGSSSSGIGVVAISTSNYALRAISTEATAGRLTTDSEFGAGVEVEVNHATNGRGAIEAFHKGSGPAVWATATKGYAVRGSGRLRFEKVSGVATIPAGSTGVTVNPGVNVVGSSFVLLTPKANIGSRGLWFTTNSTANTFRIRMSSKRSSNTKVAWLLLG